MTICVQHHLRLFGEVIERHMRLNVAGEMVTLWWNKLTGKFPDVELDLFVVMPNHFHGIVVINRSVVGGHPRMPPNEPNALMSNAGGYIDPPLRKTNLSDGIQWFKIMTTNAYIRGVKEHGWKPFPGRLWQRSYHDHIIRNEKDLQRLREYRLYNPTRWRADTFFVKEIWA